MNTTPMNTMSTILKPVYRLIVPVGIEIQPTQQLPHPVTLFVAHTIDFNVYCDTRSTLWLAKINPTNGPYSPKRPVIFAHNMQTIMKQVMYFVYQPAPAFFEKIHRTTTNPDLLTFPAFKSQLFTNEAYMDELIIWHTVSPHKADMIHTVNVSGDERNLTLPWDVYARKPLSNTAITLQIEEVPYSHLCNQRSPHSISVMTTLDNQHELPKQLKEICGNCGCTYGSHHAGISPWPYNYCPGTEGRMDWENGPGTCFKSTNTYKETTP